MAPKLNIKKVLVEKGEVVGVIAAGAITLLFAIVALVMTVKAESPTNLANKLKKQAKEVDQKLKTPPQPPLADWLPKTDPAKQSTFVTQSIDLPTRFRHGYVFASAYPMDDKALQPRIFPYTGEKLAKGDEYREGLCYFEYAQPRIYMFSKDGDDIIMLEDDKSTGAPKLNGYGKQGQGRTGAPRGLGMRGLPGIGGQPPLDSERPKEKKLIAKKLEDLANLTGFKPAETVSPVRMGIIVANFPYRLQLREFCNALYMTPDAMLDAVMEEPVLDADGNPVLDKDKKPVVKVLPAFRFKGVYVQRRQVDAGGSPVPFKGADGKVNPEGWYDHQLEDAYRGYIYVSGKRTAPDPPELQPVLINGLAMPRLLEMRDRNYKHIELDLAHIKAAIKPFLNTDKLHFKPKEFQQDDDFSPYSIQPSTAAPGTDNRGGPGFLTGPRPGGGGKPVPPMGNPRPGDPAAPKAIDPVQSCLIRLIDVTNLEPGKNYEYRVKVRMANPNYKKEASQVANPRYALDPELVSDEWYPIPGRLVVPAELNVYAVDQKEIEGKKYEGIFPRAQVDPRVATVLQFHTWVKELKAKGSSWPVGEWSVAERVIVYRGEYIDRSVKVLVPSWRSQAEAFVLVGNVVDADRPVGTDVYFGDNRYQSILLDFDNGDLSYVRSRDQTVREKARGEVLILTPDGRIQAHDTVTDKDSEERKDRLKEWRDRIEEVKTGTKAGPAADPMKSPFSK